MMEDQMFTFPVFVGGCAALLAMRAVFAFLDWREQHAAIERWLSAGREP